MLKTFHKFLEIIGVISLVYLILSIALDKPIYFGVAVALLIPSRMLYWITGGDMDSPKSLLAPHSYIDANIFHKAKSFFWNIGDGFNNVFWKLFDSWRQPIYEFFVRTSAEECAQKLHFASDKSQEIYGFRKPLLGSFSRNYFWLQKWDDMPFIKDGGAPFHPVLVGKLSHTPQGTYIRLWHRFKTCWTVFYIVWFSAVLSALVFQFIIPLMFPVPLHLIWILVGVLSLVIITMFSSVRVGSSLGEANNVDLVDFVKEVLGDPRGSVQPEENSLLRKILGKS